MTIKVGQDVQAVKIIPVHFYDKHNTEGLTILEAGGLRAVKLKYKQPLKFVFCTHGKSVADVQLFSSTFLCKQKERKGILSFSHKFFRFFQLPSEFIYCALGLTGYE